MPTKNIHPHLEQLTQTGSTFVKNNDSLLPLFAKTAIGHPFIELSATNSTNIYAMEQLQKNLAVHGAAFFAHYQTEGRGQRGKSWQSVPGANIILSVVTDSSFLPVGNSFQMSVVASLASHETLQKYAGDETCIKWPNDLYWRDRKAGGILIENVVRGNYWAWSVIGMGININQMHFPEELPNPVSLRQITGKEYSPVLLAHELCSNLEKYYRQLHTNGFAEMLAQYNLLLYKKNKEVRLRKGNIAFNCMIEAVSETGELLVSGAMQERFVFGEVEWEQRLSSKE